MIAQLYNAWWVFILLGVCAGIVSGSLGLGAGTIIVPALVLLCGFGQKSAQGMALAVMVPMALVGAVRYWRNPDIEMNIGVVGLIVCGAIVGTLLGTELAARLASQDLRRVFAIVLVLVGVRMFWGASKPQQTGLDGSDAVPAQSALLDNGGTDNGQTGR